MGNRGNVSWFLTLIFTSRPNHPPAISRIHHPHFPVKIICVSSSVVVVVVQEIKLMDLDAANDVYASYLIYVKLAQLAQDRDIALNLDEYSSNLGDVPYPGFGSGRTGAKLARAVGVEGPTPSQETVLGLFVAGQSVPVIASSMGIKDGTVL